MDIKLSNDIRGLDRQYVREMDKHSKVEKSNREILFLINKENCVRKLTNELRDYLIHRRGIRDQIFEERKKKIDDIIHGRQRIAVPVSQEIQREQIKTKVQAYVREIERFNAEYRRQIGESDEPVLKVTKTSSNVHEIHPDDINETWKEIHPQSAVGSRSRTDRRHPTHFRSLTAKEPRRNRSPSRDRSLVLTSARSMSSSPDENSQLLDSMEVLTLDLGSLKTNDISDLIDMRSIRRPRISAWDMSMIYEAKKKQYEIERNALEVQLTQRRAASSYRSLSGRTKISEIIVPKTDEQQPKQELRETRQETK